MPICSETLLRANPTCPVLNEVFREGTEPQTECPIFHGFPPPDGEEPGEPDEPTSGDLIPSPDGMTGEEWWEAYEAWLKHGDEWPEGP